MQSSAVGRAAVTVSRPKLDMVKVKDHETLLVVLSHEVGPGSVPLC